MFKKYGKKYRRNFRKGHRSFRKNTLSSRIRGKKHFQRRLNSVAEKKLNANYIVNNQAIVASTTAGTIATTQGFIRALIPAVGAAYNQRIGTKIFIRYLKLTFLVVNTDATHASLNTIGVLNLKEKDSGSNTVNIADILTAGSGLPIVDPTFIKTAYSKMGLKIKKLQANAALSVGGVFTSTMPYSLVWHRKIKVMKECTVHSDGTISLPDYFSVVLYFAAPWSGTLTNPGRYYIYGAMTYTDV